MILLQQTNSLTNEKEPILMKTYLVWNTMNETKDNNNKNTQNKHTGILHEALGPIRL